MNHGNGARSITRAAWFAVALLFLVDAVAADADARPVLRLVADEWCPVSCDTAEGPAGYAVDIASAVFAAAGYRVEFSVLPWTRAVSETRNGHYDGIVGILRKNAPDFVYPDESVGVSRYVFFTRASGRWKYDGEASLDRVLIAVANEYVFDEPVDSWIRTHRDDPRHLQVLFSQQPSLQGITMLQLGRIDAYLDDPMVVRWTLRTSRINLDLREAGLASANPFYVAFSPANPQAQTLAAAFDKGLRTLRASGRLQDLLAPYDVTDWLPRGRE